jgi:hypothetical protein
MIEKDMWPRPWPFDPTRGNGSVAKLKELNAVALLADNSDMPPEIVKEFARHGRAGVPMVLVYPAGQDAIVVPDPLSPFSGQYIPVILGALKKAAH